MFDIKSEYPHFAGKSERNPAPTEWSYFVMQSFELRQRREERL